MARRSAISILHAFLSAAAALACGGPSSSGAGPVSPGGGGSASPLPAGELEVLAQHQVDESLSDRLVVSSPALDRYVYERAGDVGDGTEEVIRCEGALPAAARDALLQALEARPLVPDAEGATASVAGPHHATDWAVWLTERPAPGAAPRVHGTTDEAHVRALWPALQAAMDAARARAQADHAACTRSMSGG